jgi:universal stress protein E
MKPYLNILVGIDFSEHSRNAAKEACHVARAHGAALHVAHILPINIAEGQDALSQASRDLTINLCGDSLKSFVEEACPEDGRCRTHYHVEVGHPFFGLRDLVNQHQIDLIVLGSRGMSSEDHQTGMVASKSARKMPIPVLLVRGAQDHPFQRIVACVDFSGASSEAMDQAAALAAQDGASLEVLHVHYPPWLLPTHVLYDLQTAESLDYREEYICGLQGQLDAFAGHLKGRFPGLAITTSLIEHMNAAYGIITHLRESEADLAVIGSRGHTPMRDFFLGTTAERIVHQSHCSVLTVRPLAHPRTPAE